MRTMIKGLAIPVVLILVLALAGCCCPKKQEVAPAPAPAPAPAAPAPAPEVTLEDLEAQAHGVGALLPIYFDFDKYNLKDEAVQKLDKTADWLGKNPTVKIRIEGNCDERGTNEYNLALGEKRASSAQGYLLKLGIAADRMATVSYGEEKPADPGHNEAAWSQNRRDDFRITEK